MIFFWPIFIWNLHIIAQHARIVGWCNGLPLSRSSVAIEFTEQGISFIDNSQTRFKDDTSTIDPSQFVNHHFCPRLHPPAMFHWSKIMKSKYARFLNRQQLNDIAQCAKYGLYEFDNFWIALSLLEGAKQYIVFTEPFRFLNKIRKYCVGE